MNLKLLFGFLTAALNLSLQGMVSHSYLVTPDNKHILIMGDWHRNPAQTFTENFIARLEYMEKASLDKPIPFIIEFEDIAEIPDHLSYPTTLKKLLAVQKQQKELPKKQFEIELCDPRGVFSREIDAILSDVSTILVEDMPDGYLQAYYTQGSSLPTQSPTLNERAWKIHGTAFKELVRSRTISLGQFLKHLEKTEATIAELAEQCTQEKLKAYIVRSLEVYKAARKTCIKLLKDQKRTVSLAYAFINSLSSCTTTHERLELFHAMHKVFRKNTDDLQEDIFLVSRLIERLSSQPAVCLYAGFAHTKNIVNTLVNDFGCTIKHETNAVQFNHPLLSAFLPDLSPWLLPTAVIDSFLEPLATKCWYCKKKKEDLKQCGFCKKAKYCDRTCQTNHWKEHKAVCVKVTEPVTVKT